MDLHRCISQASVLTIVLRGTWYFLCPVYHSLRFDVNILESAHLNATLMVHKVLYNTQSTRSLTRRPFKDG